MYARASACVASLRDYVCGADLLPAAAGIGEAPEHFHAELLARLPLDRILRSPGELGLSAPQFREAVDRLRDEAPEVVRALRLRDTRGPFSVELQRAMNLARPPTPLHPRPQSLRELAVLALLAKWGATDGVLIKGRGRELRRRLTRPRLFLEAAFSGCVEKPFLEALVYAAPLVAEPHGGRGVAALRRTLATDARFEPLLAALDDRMRRFDGLGRLDMPATPYDLLRSVRRFRDVPEREREGIFRSILERGKTNPGVLRAMVREIAYELSGDKAGLLKRLRIAAGGDPNFLVEYATFLGHVRDPQKLAKEWKAIFVDSRRHPKVLERLASAIKWIRDPEEAASAFRKVVRLARGNGKLQGALAWTILRLPDPKRRYEELMSIATPSEAWSIEWMTHFGRSAVDM